MRYVPDPSTRDTPLTLEEVEELVRVEGAPIGKTRVAGHFVSRVLATVRMHQEMLQKLHREVAIMQTKKSYEGGMPTTLSPRDAVKYLTPAERAELCDDTNRQYLASLERSTAEADAARAELARTLAATRLAAAALLEDPGLPEALRARFADLLQRTASPDATPGGHEGPVAPAAPVPDPAPARPAPEATPAPTAPSAPAPAGAAPGPPPAAPEAPWGASPWGALPAVDPPSGAPAPWEPAAADGWDPAPAAEVAGWTAAGPVGDPPEVPDEVPVQLPGDAPAAWSGDDLGGLDDLFADTPAAIAPAPSGLDDIFADAPAEPFPTTDPDEAAP